MSRTHLTDRRSATVQLTKHGNDLVDELFPRELHAHSQLLSNLGLDRDRIVESLATLTTAGRNAGGARTTPTSRLSSLHEKYLLPPGVSD